MTHRVVARFAHQRVRCPSATAHARLGVIASAAEAPEIVDGATAIEGNRLGPLPDLPQPRLTHVAPDICSAQPRTGFDRTIRLDPHHCVACITPVEINLRVEDVANNRFIGAVIANVARWLEEEAALSSLDCELGEERHDLQ